MIPSVKSYHKHRRSESSNTRTRATGVFVTIIASTRIHTAIVEVDSDQPGGLATVKVIRLGYPRVPCILLTARTDQEILGKALQLEVFGVVGKPVDMDILRELLHRLFVKKYNSNLFAR